MSSRIPPAIGTRFGSRGSRNLSGSSPGYAGIERTAPSAPCSTHEDYRPPHAPKHPRNVPIQQRPFQVRLTQVDWSHDKSQAGKSIA